MHVTASCFVFPFDEKMSPGSVVRNDVLQKSSLQAAVMTSLDHYGSGWFERASGMLFSLSPVGPMSGAVGHQMMIV